jgi:malonyl-CoA/methylmalonyl-CoA synthetase
LNLYDLFAIARRRAPSKVALRMPALPALPVAPAARVPGAMSAPGVADAEGHAGEAGMPGEADPADGAGAADGARAAGAAGAAGLAAAPQEHDAVEWSYDELLGRAEGLAAGLRRWGLVRGDRVACFLGNGPEWVLLHLALLRLGVVLVPLNLAYRRREIGNILSDAAPRLLVTGAGQLALVDEVPAEERASLETVLPVEELDAWWAGQDRGWGERPEGGGRLGDAAAGETAAGEMTAGGQGAAGEAMAPGGDDLALLLYTSGTTGPSKGAMISHNNLLATVTGLLAAWSWRADDVVLLALPLFHVHGLVVGLDCALAAGATVELRRRFDAAAAAAELASGAATLFFGVPTMYVRLLEELRRRTGETAERSERGGGSGPVSAAELAAVRMFCSGSAPLAPQTFTAFRDLTGHTILERYGMTEAGMILSNPYLGPRVPGQVGAPLPGVSVRLVDAAGRDLPPGTEGELLVRGANVFSGYWQAPEKTAASFVHDDAGRRWFRTGDLARQDPATGAFTLLGRRHELILCGGFNVYPREIEETLLAFPGVREAAVVGRPHPEWGEVPVAYLVAAGPVDPPALLAFCKGQLAAFKVPRELRFLDALPRNALGKLQKHLLP